MQEPKISQIIDNSKNKRKNVCIVIPTFNQYNETKKNIDLIKKQTLVPDIIIIDNNSGDGTFDKFSKEYNDIILIKSAGNYGGAGGFFLGQKYAYENGYKWIILNDNDAYPVDKYIIENIIKFKKDSYYNSFINTAEENNTSLKVLHFGAYTRNEIKNKGFIDYKLFIYGDDVEYYNRFNNLNLIKIDTKYFHPMKNFYPSKMIYFLVRNQNYNNKKYKGLGKIIKDNIIFLFGCLIYKYIWGLDNYFYFFKAGLSDILKNDFSKNEEIISSKIDDGMKFQKLKIEDFLKKFKNNKKVLFSIKKIFNGKIINKEFTLIKNITVPRKEIFGKTILITNGFNSMHRILLSFYFKKVIFIKDIYWEKNEIEYFEFNNKFIRKILVLILFIGFLPLIIILSTILKFKKL